MADTRENIRLVQYVNDLFKNWATKRAENKEIDWQYNLDAFLAQNSPTWKKKDAERKESDENWRSDVVVRILKRKVIAAFVFIIDTVFQGGQIPFSLEPTPGTYDEQETDIAKESAKKMEDKIRGQFKECKAEYAIMKAILQMALYGGCFLKGPVLKTKTVKKWVRKFAEGYEGNQQYSTYEKTTYQEKIPAIECKSVWSMFVDPEVDHEDIQKGRGIIEYTPVSPFELRKMQGIKGYDAEAIGEVISRNKGKKPETVGTLPPNLRNITDPGKSITYKEFWGRVPRAFLTEESQKDYQLKGSPAKRFDIVEDVEHSGDEVEVMLAMADDILIRLHINEGGERPYRYVPWEISPDEFYGIGCADNLQDVQKMVTGGVRNFVDNKALSGNVITATVGGAMLPGQKQDLYPGKNFRFQEGTDIGRSFSAVTIPDVGDSLLTLISLFEKIGDEDCGIPTIMQGDARPKQKADTATEMTMLMQNAGKYIGQVIRNFDENGIEPMVMGFYDYNMMYETDPEAMGDYKCHALGFNSFFNKSTLLAAMIRFLEVVRQDPQAQMYVKFKTIYETVGKAMDLEPSQIVYTDEEIQQRQMEQQQAMVAEQEAQAQAEAQLQQQQAQQQMALEQQKAQQQLAMDRQKMEADDMIADEELERELVRKDVEHKQAMAMKQKEHEQSIAMQNMEARNQFAMQKADHQQQEKVTKMTVAQKAKQEKEKSKAKPKPAKKGKR